MLTLEELQTKCQGEVFLVSQVNKRPEKVVPRVHKLKEAHDEESGFTERQDDLPEDAEFAATVDASCFGELLRYPKEELTQEKDVKGSGKESGDPERLERPDPTNPLEHTVERNHHYGEGDHHGGQGDEEDLVASAPGNA